MGVEGGRRGPIPWGLKLETVSSAIGHSDGVYPHHCTTAQQRDQRSNELQKQGAEKMCQKHEEWYNYKVAVTCGQAVSD